MLSSPLSQRLEGQLLWAEGGICPSWGVSVALMFDDASTPCFLRISFQAASGSALWQELHCDRQFSRSVVSDSLQPHESQHARPLCPSPTPRACSNSCPLCRWCHPTISSSVIHFSSHLQSFPASGFFPMSQLFPSGGQSIVTSASASVLPMNIQDWFPLGWTGWISLQSKGLQRVFSNTTVQKHQSFKALVLTKCLSSALLFSWSLEGRLARLSFFSSDPRWSPSFKPPCRAVCRKLWVPQGCQGRR